MIQTKQSKKQRRNAENVWWKQQFAPSNPQNPPFEKTPAQCGFPERKNRAATLKST